MTRKSLVTIDPGENTGWAYFKQDFIPVATGCWHSKDYKTLQSRFKNLLETHSPRLVVMEDVQSMGLRSMAAAKGLNKLNRIIGIYINECNVLGIKYKLITVSKWKGTLKNKETNRDRVISGTK